MECKNGRDLLSVGCIGCSIRYDKAFFTCILVLLANHLVDEYRINCKTLNWKVKVVY